MKHDRVIAERTHKTIYCDKDKCVKVFHSKYSKVDVLKEALNHAIIEEMGIKVPKLIEVIDDDGCPAIVSEYIQGKTLAECIAEEPEKKDQFIELMVELQLKIHNKTSLSLEKLKDSMHDKICRSDFTATTRYDLHYRLKEADNYNNVCHGDFVPENIILTDSGEIYIVDWSKAVRGVALADVAATYLAFWLRGDIYCAKKYIEIFCEKSNTEKKAFQSWLPIVAAAYSTECDEKEKKFLQSLVIDGDYQ